MTTRKPGFESKKLCRALVENARVIAGAAPPESLTIGRCSCGQTQAAVGPLPECMHPNPGMTHEWHWRMSLVEFEAEVEALPEDTARPKRPDPGIDKAMRDAQVEVNQDFAADWDSDKFTKALAKELAAAGRLKAEKLRPAAAGSILARIERDAATLAPSDVLALAQAADIVSKL